MRDVIIVEDGPAGRNAAQVRGRLRDAVLRFDHETPRIAAAPLAWRVFTRDGTPPVEIRASARADLTRYDTVDLRRIEVAGASPESACGEVRCRTQAPTGCRGADASRLRERHCPALSYDLSDPEWTPAREPYAEADVPGFSVVGHASRRVRFAVVTAAGHAMAAFVINTELRRADTRRLVPTAHHIRLRRRGYSWRHFRGHEHASATGCVVWRAAADPSRRVISHGGRPASMQW